MKRFEMKNNNEQIRQKRGECKQFQCCWFLFDWFKARPCVFVCVLIYKQVVKTRVQVVFVYEAISSKYTAIRSDWLRCKFAAATRASSQHNLHSNVDQINDEPQWLKIAYQIIHTHTHAHRHAHAWPPNQMEIKWNKSNRIKRRAKKINTHTTQTANATILTHLFNCYSLCIIALLTIQNEHIEQLKKKSWLTNNAGHSLNAK